MTMHSILRAPPDNTAIKDSLLARMSRWRAVRILVFALTLAVIVVATGLASRLLVPPSPSPLHHSLLIVTNLASAAALLIAYALIVRLMEHRSPAEIGLLRGSRLFLVGAVVGTALMGAVYFGLWCQGLATFAPGTGSDGLFGALVVMFAAAVLEELLFRAVLFRIVEEATGTAVAVFVSAIAFGLIHGLNPGATAISSMAIAIEAGVMLALAYVATRNLWLPIGIHMSWNFAEGSLFGAKVSGYSEPHSLLKTTLSGPELLTGGAFGPEASLVSVAVCLLASAVLLTMIVRRHNWRNRRKSGDA
jgi:membrane protease YdiL (CAAX protease family)